VTPLRFPDHHRYTADDWATIAARASASGAALIVTTEKDAVKLPPAPPVPVWVLHSELRLLTGSADVAAALDRVLQWPVAGST